MCEDSTFLNSLSLQKLEQLNQYPDFNNYLIFVLTKLKSEGKFLKYLLFYSIIFSFLKISLICLGRKRKLMSTVHFQTSLLLHSPVELSYPYRSLCGIKI